MPQGIELSDALVDFVQGGISIIVASRDAGNRPAVGVGLGCRVSPDRRRMTVFVQASSGAGLLGAIRETGAVAVAFSEPLSHRSVQFKGNVESVAPIEAPDAAPVARHAEAFGQRLARAGYDEAWRRALLHRDPADVVAVTFTPGEAFSQTPGPQAGSALKP